MLRRNALTQPNHAVVDALNALRDGLDPFLQSSMAPYTNGLDWPMVLKALDLEKGKSGDYPYKRTDVAMQLRMITEPLGNLRYFFSKDDPNRVLSTYGSELRIVRRRSAHNEDFEPFEALRAVDTVRLVLEHIGDHAGAGRMLDLRASLLNSLAAPAAPAAEVAPARVEQVVSDLLAAPTPEDAVDLAGPVSEEIAENKLATTLSSKSGAVPWTPWPVTVVGEKATLDNLRSREARTRVRSVIEDIVDAEGPVHIDRLVRLTGNAFGFQRVAADRQARIRRQVPNADVEVVDDFVWPAGIDRDRWHIYRIAPAGERPINEISPEELNNAARSLLAQRGPMPEDEMWRAVLEVFGRTRMTAQAVQALENARVIASRVEAR